MQFWKYHGAGNDFILIDGRKEWPFEASHYELVAQLCHRRFGIGADGLMVLTHHPSSDFEMHYYNSDGRPSSMCGNGGRCIVAFASALGISPASPDGLYRFMAVDGLHRALILDDGQVKLEMLDVSQVERNNDDYILDTGSPHYVRIVDDVDDIDIVPEAHQIRYGERFSDEGINVNFVQLVDECSLSIRTYERGVEAETYACGTGVVAASVVQASLMGAGNHRFHIAAKGGPLQVDLSWDGQRARSIWLIGGASFVYKGFIELNEFHT